MRFRPRHYILIAIIVALGIFNFLRLRHPHPALAPATSTAPSGPISQSPGWQAFDKAVALRDAPDPQFQPAFSDLQQQLKSASPAEAPDLQGCRTWLIFYRQSGLHASANDPWKQRSTSHLDGCLRRHRDISG
ncbi:MAG TPA: hypothetical protein VM865_02855 [Acidobacteriaceae bacterium]|nr:hypothetical protein [Acidobacteriaceae bacterium]